MTWAIAGHHHHHRHHHHERPWCPPPHSCFLPGLSAGIRYKRQAQELEAQRAVELERIRAEQEAERVRQEQVKDAAVQEAAQRLDKLTFDFSFNGSANA